MANFFEDNSLLVIRVPKTRDINTVVEWWHGTDGGDYPTFNREEFPGYDTDYDYFYITEDFIKEKLGEDIIDRIKNGQVVWGELIEVFIDFLADDIGKEIQQNLYQEVWKAQIRKEILPYKMFTFLLHAIEVLYNICKANGFDMIDFDSLFKNYDANNNPTNAYTLIYDRAFFLVDPNVGIKYDESYLLGNTLAKFIDGNLAARDKVIQMEETQEPIPLDVASLPSMEDENV